MPYSVPPPEPSLANDLLNAEPAVYASVSFAAIDSDTVSPAAATLNLISPSHPEAFSVEPSNSSAVDLLPSHSTVELETRSPLVVAQETNPPVQDLPQVPTLDSPPVLQPAPEPTTPPSDAVPNVEQPPTQPPSEPPAQPDANAADEDVETNIETFTLQRIEVVGSTVLSDTELNPIIQPLTGRPVSQTELEAATDAITQLYLNQGFLTSRALDPEVTGNVAQIQVVEGGVERVDIQGAERIHERYIRDRILRAARTPLNTNALENQLRLLRLNPLFENVEASLRAGDRFGQSIVIVRVTEADPFSGTVGIANDAPPSVGSERLNLDLTYRNPTGNGDTVSGFYRRSTTGGLESYGLDYQIPLNARDGTLQLQVERNRNEITQEPFDELGIRGGNTRYQLSFRQPLVRSPQEEFALSLGFAFQDGQTFVFNDIPFPFGLGVEDNGVSRTSVIQFGQDYVHRDRRGAWALRSQFNLGTGLFDATSNEGTLPDGQFISWLGQAQRVQSLGDDHLLIIQADLQLTPDALLPSQQFAIGGGQSVRGYRQNARSGDNGFRLSIEDRIALQRDESGNPTLQLAPFADMGAVWNDPDNPLPRKDNFLAGLGVGLLWNPIPHLDVRLDYGIPIVSIGDRGNNAQDEGFYFRVGYRF